MDFWCWNKCTVQEHITIYPCIIQQYTLLICGFECALLSAGWVHLWPWQKCWRPGVHHWMRMRSGVCCSPPLRPYWTFQKKVIAHRFLFPQFSTCCLRAGLFSHAAFESIQIRLILKLCALPKSARESYQTLWAGKCQWFLLCSLFRFRKHVQCAEPRLRATVSQWESGLQELCPVWRRGLLHSPRGPAGSHCLNQDCSREGWKTCCEDIYCKMSWCKHVVLNLEVNKSEGMINDTWSCVYFSVFSIHIAAILFWNCAEFYHFRLLINYSNQII